MELVKQLNDKLITELRAVAEVYGKEHRFLIRSVHNIIKDLPELSCEYIPTTFKTSEGNTYNTYYLTEKGFYILASSFTGTKARMYQSKFYDAFNELKKENEQLRYICSNLINGVVSKSVHHDLINGAVCKSVHRELLSTDEIIKRFNELKKENEQFRLKELQEGQTLCISDIVCRFKDLPPWEATYQLLVDGYLVKRAMGVFPSAECEQSNSIIAVSDRHGNYYPRYTNKGISLVTEYFLNKGYMFK